jgi:signal transduction histidine kinase
LLCVALLALLFIALCGLLIASRSIDWTSPWLPVANLAACGATALGCIRRGAHEPRERAGWMLIAAAAGLASVAATEAVASSYRGIPGPIFPSPGTWIAILALPVGGIGLICFPIGPTTHSRRIRAALDSLLLGSSLLFIVLESTHPRIIKLDYARLEYRDACFLFLGLATVDLTIIYYLLRDNIAAVRGPLSLLAGALALCSLPMVLALYQVVGENEFRSGHLVHLATLLGIAVVGVAAWSPWPLHGDSVQAAPSRRSKQAVECLPYVPSALCILVVICILSGSRIVIWTGIVAILVLIARLALGMFDYWDLTRSLEDRVQERTRQLEASQARLAQTERLEALGRLAGGVAHDFNNLLTAILGYTDVLRDVMPEDARSREIIAQICRTGERAGSLTRQLLTFARRQPSQPRVFDPNDLLREFQHLLKHILGLRVQLTVDCGRDVGSVKLDPRKFEQIIMNIAINARDAMPDGGVLFIETEGLDLDSVQFAEGAGMGPGRFVRLRLRDTGVGIHPENLPQIFDPFFTTKDPAQGTGLGLAICYGIVKEAGGQIVVETQVGAGTTFDVYLPRVDAESP